MSATLLLQNESYSDLACEAVSLHWRSLRLECAYVVALEGSNFNFFEHGLYLILVHTLERSTYSFCFFHCSLLETLFQLSRLVYYIAVRKRGREWLRCSGYSVCVCVCAHITRHTHRERERERARKQSYIYDQLNMTSYKELV